MMKRVIGAIMCMLFGCESEVVYYNPFTGERDCGMICMRCGKVKIAYWGEE